MNGYVNRYRDELLSVNPRQRYVGIGVTALWIVVLFGLGFVPAFRGAMSAQTAIATARQNEEALKLKVAAIEQAKQTLAQQTTNQVLADNAVPRDRRAVNFVNELDLAIATNNLTVESLDYGGIASARTETRSTSSQSTATTTTKTKGSEKTLGFTLKLMGDYTGVRGFVQRLENMPRIAKIDTLSINLDSSDNGGNLTSELTLVVEGSFYYFDEGGSTVQ
ncbi:hypothetical protein HGA91_00575 [candidate division WWE3 bacterium]|nr:hypothetical protein [candidate division WWE3 bacterium]